MGDLADIDDAFDAALNLEETHIDEGWEEGLEYVGDARTRRRIPVDPELLKWRKKKKKKQNKTKEHKIKKDGTARLENLPTPPLATQ